MTKLTKMTHLINILFGDKTKLKGEDIKDSFIMQSPGSIEISINANREIIHCKTD